MDIPLITIQYQHWTICILVCTWKGSFILPRIQDYLQHLEVFKRLETVDLIMKCIKCEFFKTKAHYLGYHVGSNGLQPLPEKTEEIRKLIAPTNINEL